MSSAVHWYEAAVSGKLERVDQDVPLRRAVLRGRSKNISTFKLPAGLSAIVRGKRPTLASWNVVPVKALAYRGSLDRAIEDLTDSDLPAHLAIADARTSRRLIESRRREDPYAGAALGKSRAVSDKVAAGLVSSPSAIAVRVISTLRAGAASPPSAMAKHKAAEPLAPSGSSNGPALAGRHGALARMSAALGQTAASQRVTDRTSGGAILPAIRAEVHSQSSSARLLQSVKRTRGVAGDGVHSRIESSSASAVMDVMKSVDPETGVRSQLKPPIVANGLAAAVVDPATRASSYDQSLRASEIVPRKAMRREIEGAVTQAIGVEGPPNAASRRGSASQFRTVPNLSPSHTASSDWQGGQAGMMVTLRGDVMMDGRKMGRLVATGQASTASLPTLSGSAINLRAVPIFAGTGAPL